MDPGWNYACDHKEHAYGWGLAAAGIILNLVARIGRYRRDRGGLGSDDVEGLEIPHHGTRLAERPPGGQVVPLDVE